MKSLLAVCFSFFLVCASAFAEGRTEIFSSKKTPFQTLKDLFETSRSLIKEADVDLFDNAGSLQKCSTVSQTAVEKIFSSNLIRFDLVLPADPGHGPLFPGTPESVSSILVFNRELQRDTQAEEWKSVAKSVVKKVYTDEIEELFTDGRLSDGPVQLKVRKNQDLITYEVLIFKGSSQQVSFYGYCYRN